MDYENKAFLINLFSTVTIKVTFVKVSEKPKEYIPVWA